MSSVITDQRFGVNADLAVKVPCACASTTNITLSGEQTIDGITTNEDRVLVTGQTDTTENGIYVSDTGDWVRAPDWDGIRDVVPGTIVRVVRGTSYYGYWAVTTPSSGSITPGTTSVSLSRVDADGVLREDLANSATDDGTKGVNLVYYPLKTGETGVQNYHYDYHNAFRFIPYANIAAIEAETSTTDLSTYIQNFFDSTYSDEKYFPSGKYYIANILMRDGLKIWGAGYNTWLYLPDHTADLITESGDIFCTLANHNTYTDGGTRAADETNTTYYISNIHISNIRFDGNKANNTASGLSGDNGAVKGAGVNLQNAKRVTIDNCFFINNRLDGVFVGYTLQGGSDYCVIDNNYFEGNGRTGIAQVTGKNNIISNNTIKHTGSGGGIDIEANFASEVNYKHRIFGNYIENPISINSVANALQYDIEIFDNIIVGALDLGASRKAQGANIHDNIFIGDGTDTCITGTPDNTTTTYRAIRIVGNQFYNFLNIRSTDTTGGLSDFHMENNYFEVEYGLKLTRPHNITFRNNEIVFSGGSNTEAAVYIEFGQVTSVTMQGDIIFEGNKFSGSGLLYFLNVAMLADPPSVDKDFVQFSHNNINVAHTNKFIQTAHELTFNHNKVYGLVTANYIYMTGSVDGLQFNDNEIWGTSVVSGFLAASTFANCSIRRNKFNDFVPALVRPQNCDISYNQINNAGFLMTYSFTSGGVGNNTITHNNIAGTSTGSYAITVATGGSYSSTDFAQRDIIAYNTRSEYFSNGALYSTAYTTAERYSVYDIVP